MSVAVSASAALRTRLCPTPGCPNEVIRGEFCETCKRDVPRKERKRIAQSAEIIRQGVVLAERRGQEVARRRHQRRKVVDGRVRALARLDRDAGLAAARGDHILERALRDARAAVELELETHGQLAKLVHQAVVGL